VDLQVNISRAEDGGGIYSEIFIFTYKCIRRGRVGNTHLSYSWGSGFKSQPGDRISWLRICWFPQFPHKNQDSSLNYTTAASLFHV
jgi:hypothetical protein